MASSKTCTRTNASGFALLETIIAFVVMAVGLLALLSFHSESQRNVSDAKAKAEAIALAEDKLQELESFLASDDPRIVTIGTSTDSNNPINGVLAEYTREWEVAYADHDGDGAVNDCSDNPAADFYCPRWVEVSVSWDDRESDLQTVALNSEVFFREPTQGAENFLKLVSVAQAASGGSPWGGNNGDETETGDDTGDDGNGDGSDGGQQDGNTDEPPNEGVDYYLTISGGVNAEGGNDGSLTGVTVDNGNDFAADWTCVHSSSSYSCTSTGIPENLTWSGRIIFSSDKWFCLASGSNSSGSLSKTYTSIDSNQEFDVVIRKNSNKCDDYFGN